MWLMNDALANYAAVSHGPNHQSAEGQRWRNKEMLDDLSLKDEKGPSSVRPTSELNCLKKKIEKQPEKFMRHEAEREWTFPRVKIPP